MYSEIITQYEVHVDLYGASLAWIDSLAEGASARGADNVETYANPAFAGIVAKTDDREIAERVHLYLKRTAPLALWKYALREKKQLRLL